MNAQSLMAALAVKVLLLAPGLPARAQPARATPSPQPKQTLDPIQRYLQSDDLYSQRARRRAAALLRIELLELRKAQLDRAKAVIEGKLPLDQLLVPSKLTEP